MPNLDNSSLHFQLGLLFSIHDVKDLDADSSGCCEQVFGILGDINRLARVLNLESTDSLEHVSIVHANSLIVRAGEKQIAIVVVLHFEHWSEVTSQIDWLHRHFC